MSPKESENILRSLRENLKDEGLQRRVRNHAQNKDRHRDAFLRTAGGDAAHIVPKVRKDLYGQYKADPFHISSVMILGPPLHRAYDDRAWSLFPEAQELPNQVLLAHHCVAAFVELCCV